MLVSLVEFSPARGANSHWQHKHNNEALQKVMAGEQEEQRDKQRDLSKEKGRPPSEAGLLAVVVGRVTG